MYAIMGITGNVGGSTARALLQDGKKVRGIVRSRAKAAPWEAAGVELAVADVDDADALESAFRGVEGVFVMVPPNFAPAAGYPETRAMIATLRKALSAARPAKAVYLSSIGAHRKSGLGLITQLHILEQEMSSLPVSNAFVRAAWFLENYQQDAGSARDQGAIDVFLTPAERAFPMVATDDIGRLAAKTLRQDWKGNRYLELEGPARYSPLDAAVVFSRLLKQQVTANPVPRDEWARLFEKQGMAPDRTGPRMEMLDGFNSGWIDFERADAEHVLGNRTLEEVLRDLLRK
jgi:NAD(P)H dehydrogenase (quinone)